MGSAGLKALMFKLPMIRFELIPLLKLKEIRKLSLVSKQFNKTFDQNKYKTIDKYTLHFEVQIC